MWIPSQSFAVLVAVQVLSGAVWAAYDLATLLMFFETIPSQKRVGVLTVFNLANAGAVVAGSAVGGAVLAACSASRAAYLALFLISAVARAGALVMLVRVPRSVPASPAAQEAPAAQPLRQPVFRPSRPVAAPQLAGPHWRRGRTPVAAAGQRPTDPSLPQLPG
jgi:MFS family permease